MQKMFNARFGTLVLLIAAAGSPEAAAVTLRTTDFIPTPSRTNFNGFEGITTSPLLVQTWTEDGVRVDQVNGDSGGIWTDGVAQGLVAEGGRSWYPNGGDNGYTTIKKADGSAFESVGFLAGDGGFLGFLLYEILDGAAVVLSGSTAHTNAFHYVGFSGGGFTEVRVRSAGNLLGTFYTAPTNNSLILDSIELAGGAVPEPTAVALAGLALFLGARGDRRARARRALA